MKNLIAPFAFGLSILFVTGCATQRTGEAYKIIETDESSVKHCHFIGEASGSSQYGGLAMQEAGKANAKNEALNQAATMQATHVVWKAAQGGFFGAHALALVYKCNKKN